MKQAIGWQKLLKQAWDKHPGVFWGSVIAVAYLIAGAVVVHQIRHLPSPADDAQRPAAMTAPDYIPGGMKCLAVPPDRTEDATAQKTEDYDCEQARETQRQAEWAIFAERHQTDSAFIQAKAAIFNAWMFAVTGPIAAFAALAALLALRKRSSVKPK